jgi:Ca2+-binding RTX toxin-like protein/Tol biopolymer transport system component
MSSRLRRRSLAIVALVVLLGVLEGAAAAPGDVRLVSSSDAGVRANGTSRDGAVSADGTKVAFTSNATNLDAADTDPLADVYVKDLVTGDVVLASSSDAGIGGNGESRNPAISADGRFVAFESTATNLDPGDPTPPPALFETDVYVKDLVTGDLLLASTDASGVKGNGWSFGASLSADGRVIAFGSRSTNLDPADTTPFFDAYVKDLSTGAIRVVSTADDGTIANTGLGSFSAVAASISGDGTRVAFTSGSTNLDPGDTDVGDDVYVKDLGSGDLRLVSTSDDGVKGNGPSNEGRLSLDGSTVAFTSAAKNLDPLDHDELTDVYVKRLGSNDLVLASTSAAGVKSNRLSGTPRPSANGMRVAFRSSATNFDLRAQDPGGFQDVYVKDLATGALDLASTSSAGGRTNGSTSIPGSLDADGSVVALGSNANLLAPTPDPPTFFANDVYVKELGGPQQPVPAPAPPPSAGTYLYLSGYPGGEQVQLFTSADATFGGGGSEAGVEMAVFPSAGGPCCVGGSWRLFIRPPEEGRLVPGVYEDAVGGIGSVPGRPVLTIFSSYNQSFHCEGGRFVVHEASFGFSQAVVALDVSFEQVCANTLMTGRLKIEPPPPPPPPEAFCDGERATIVGTPASEELIGTEGRDVIAGLGGEDTIDALGGDDLVCGGDGEDRLLGGPGADRLFGDAGPDTLLGGDGGDRLAAGDGSSHVLVGDGGDDTLVSGGSGAFMVGGPGDDTLDGSAGREAAGFAAAPGPVDVDLARGTATGDGKDTLVAVEAIEGSPFGDRIAGDDGENVLRGGAGADSLLGRGGADDLDGGADDDELDGGEGPDTARHESAPGPVRVDLGEGSSSGDGTDRLVSIEGAVGSSHDDVLRGDEGANVLDGASGNDLLVGKRGDDTLLGADGAGFDTMIGGPGDDSMTAGCCDTLDYSAAPARVVVDLEAGTATGDGVDTLHGAFLTVVGSRFDDELRGDDFPNVLAGGPGSDLLDGRGSSDTVSYATAAASVVIDLDQGTARGEGSDRLASFEHAVGSRLADTLLGTTAGDTLEGGPGVDRIDGRGGDDNLLGDAGDDSVTGGSGNDVVNGGEGDDVAQGGHGDDLVAGARGEDRLFGDGGNDLVVGGAGDDRLDGGSGNDRLVGDDGFDRLDGGPDTDDCDGERTSGCP